MATLRIWKSLLERARDRAELSSAELKRVDEVLSGQTGEIPINLDDLPVAMAKALLDEGKLKPNERAAIVLRVIGMKADRLATQELYDTVVAGPIEFGSILLASPFGQPNSEIRWNGRWYPVMAFAKIHEEDKTAKFASIAIQLGVGSETIAYEEVVNPAWFQQSDGSRRDLTVLQVLEKAGLRRLQTEAATFNLRLVKSERLAGMSGRQMLLTGSVLEIGRAWYGSGLSELAMGTPDTPRRVVVEDELRDNEHRSHFYPGARSQFDEKISRLPLVRVFSLETKRYVYADIDDLIEYEYDASAIDRLMLPPDMKSVLDSVFRASKRDLFGDHVRNKHGGIVILACGHPGVGKTLTAEVYAELSQRPLYILEFGELGTTVAQIEKNLSTVFARVVKWHAVLQFDECEIFLATRGEDLERSAIVGIFLRMLDYYEGLLFLTTNRPDVLDHAVHSRVMLRLDYPDLDVAARAGIWQAMLAAAGMELVEASLTDLAAEPLNGRQIRNRIRLARILFGEGKVTADQLQSLARYNSVRPDEPQVFVGPITRFRRKPDPDGDESTFD